MGNSPGGRVRTFSTSARASTPANLQAAVRSVVDRQRTDEGRRYASAYARFLSGRRSAEPDVNDYPNLSTTRAESITAQLVSATRDARPTA